MQRKRLHKNLALICVTLLVFTGCDSNELESIVNQEAIANVEALANEELERQSEPIPQEEVVVIEGEEENLMYIKVNDTVLTAKLTDNSSAQALIEMLKDGPITVDMHDYGNFEKVGNLPKELPSNNEQITTEPGDIILYQGQALVIYYDQNSWNFTRLGKIDDATKESLLSVLGSGDVSVTLSLDNE